jgi:hypothetical protein
MHRFHFHTLSFTDAPNGCAVQNSASRNSKKSDARATPSRIEDYAFVSDTQRGALISRRA